MKIANLKQAVLPHGWHFVPRTSSLPFFTTKPTGKATGLELSLSCDIVKANGVELTLETLSAEAAAQAGKESGGTIFIIQLPISTTI